MASKKILFLMLALVFLGGSCFAQGYMSVKVGAAVQFVYVQVINALNGHFTVRMDVTGKVPYEIQTVSGEKVLIIN